MACHLSCRLALLHSFSCLASVEYDLVTHSLLTRLVYLIGLADLPSMPNIQTMLYFLGVA